MADNKPISQLPAASDITDVDLFVLEQSQAAKKLTGALLKSFLTRNLADAYDSTQTYVKGAIVMYGGNVYECTTAITTPEVWNPNHWRQVNLFELADYALTHLIVNFNELDPGSQPTASYNVNDLTLTIGLPANLTYVTLAEYQYMLTHGLLDPDAYYAIGEVDG